jgi:hypothetical protein
VLYGRFVGVRGVRNRHDVPVGTEVLAEDRVVWLADLAALRAGKAVI